MKKNPLGETKIYYSRWENGFMALISGGAMVYGIYDMAINHFSFTFLVLLFMLGIITIHALKKIFNKTPQLIINSKGIQPIGEKLFTWNYVAHTRIRKTSDRYVSTYLQLYRKGKKGQPTLITEIDITRLGISCGKLENTILEYRREIRAKKKKH